jgi:hypothetical protein
MLAEIRPTDGGTSLHYTGRAYPLTAYMATPGHSRVAVAWQGHADVSNLGAFCKAAAAKVLDGMRPEFTMWVLTTEGRRRVISLDAPPPVPPRLQETAKLVRLECRPKLAGGARLEPTLTAWARLDELSPEDGVAVSIEPEDLPRLRTEIAKLVHNTARVEASIGDIEAALAAVGSDIAELSVHDATQAST